MLNVEGKEVVAYVYSVVQRPSLSTYTWLIWKRTVASSAKTPEWAMQPKPKHWGRLCKYGDLCSYNPNGTLEDSSRKDTQIKIRGLRVELIKRWGDWASLY